MSSDRVRDDATCLNCRWAKWGAVGERMATCDCPVDVKALPASVTVTRDVIDADAPLTDCPTWEAK